jgi:tRNA-2-methylthio-N6-dimethylallyladenosine synthase
MVGLAFRDKTGKYLKENQRNYAEVDEFMPIEEVGFDNEPVRTSKTQAWIPISNGCNNFCTYCCCSFYPRREISRPFEDIINEAKI